MPKIAKVEGAINDVDFIKLLDRCDTWTVLLTIPGRPLARQNKVTARYTRETLHAITRRYSFYCKVWVCRLVQLCILVIISSTTFYKRSVYCYQWHRGFSVNDLDN